MRRLLNGVAQRNNDHLMAGLGRTTCQDTEFARVCMPEQKYLVTVYEDLSALSVRYESLFANAGLTSVFLTLPWFRNYVQSVLAPDERLRIYVVESADPPQKACGVLMMHYKASPSATLGLKTLRGLANYYSPLFGPVTDSELIDVQPIYDALASAIAGDTMRWDTIDLHPLSVDGPHFTALILALRKAGLMAQTYFYAGNWYHRVSNQTYNQYLETRSSRISKTGKRTRRILESGGRFRFELFRTTEALERGIADYNTVYNSSWKVPEPFPNFIPGLVQTCAEQGWLRLGIAYMDNQPAAAQIWIVAGKTAAIYKMAYDERFAKQSVGTVLTSLLMEHVIEVDKVDVVDYLTGDDNYKRDWMSERRERWGILAFNRRTPFGLLAASRHVGGRAVKRAVEAVRNFGGRKAPVKVVR